MSEDALLQNYLLIGAALFAIGMVGFVVRRNMIVMFLCAEIMLQGVSLSLVAWGRYHGDWGGQALVVFIIAVAACEAGIALALIVTLGRRSDSLDVIRWQQLREEGRTAYIDRQIPEVLEAQPQWPTLTPSGIAPEVEVQQLTHRSHV